MWPLQVFQEQENTVKARASFWQQKGAGSTVTGPGSQGFPWISLGKALLGSWGGYPGLKHLAFCQAWRWLGITMWDWKEDVIGTWTMHSWCYLGLRCFAKQMKGRNKCRIRADHQFLVNRSIQLQLFFHVHLWVSMKCLDIFLWNKHRAFFCIKRNKHITQQHWYCPSARTKHFLSHLWLQSRDINKPKTLAESRQSVSANLHQHSQHKPSTFLLQRAGQSHPHHSSTGRRRAGYVQRLGTHMCSKTFFHPNTEPLPLHYLKMSEWGF